MCESNYRALQGILAWPSLIRKKMEHEREIINEVQ